MANTLDQMNIPFNDFKLNTVIDPEEFDQNFAEVQTKTNNAITQVNTNSTDIETLQTNETTNEARLTQAEADIDSLEVEDTANKARLTVNEADIDALETADTQNVKLTGNQTVAGKKTFSTSPAVPTPTATTDASTKGYVDTSIAGVTLGQIPDDSLTNAKMATDVKIGSLATLTTTEKSNVTGAINEVDANANSAQSTADTADGKADTNALNISSNLGKINENTVLRELPTVGGTADAITLDTSLTTFDLTKDGNPLTFIPTANNTGAVTVNVDGQGAKAISKPDGVGGVVALEADDFVNGTPVQLLRRVTGDFFLYAPKGGANPIDAWGNAFNRTTALYGTNVPSERVSVTGSGWVIGVHNADSASPDFFNLEIDGVIYYGTATNSTTIEGRETQIILARFESSMKFLSTYSISGISYLLGDEFGVGTPIVYDPHSVSDSGLTTTVNGSGWIYGTYLDSGNGRGLTVDGVDVFRNLWAEDPAYIPLFTRFESSFVVRSGGSARPQAVNYVFD